MKKLFPLFITILSPLITISQEVDSLVDFNSLASIYVVAQKGNKPLWSGTGFFLQVRNTIYLITNNHVVGGKYHTDEFKRNHKNDSAKDTLPDVLSIRLFNKKVGTYKFESIGLEDAKGNLLYTKIYENEKDTSTLLDAVAIPIKGLNNIITSVTINGYDSSSIGDIPLYTSQQLFVIGYPQNTSTFYPIWKGGTIASEPNFLHLGISTFYIDATTRKGMSGSPVIFRDDKIVSSKHGIQFFSGLVTKLIGIYSAQNFDTELGVVTRIETIYRNLYKQSD